MSIDISEIVVSGWEAATRGMRNPMNSWDRTDSGLDYVCEHEEFAYCDACPNHDKTPDPCGAQWVIGPNDRELMEKLSKGGPCHAKYRRFIIVTMDVNAPLYWWKEFDTYKVGTVANSCSTMHKIADHVFTRDDFSCDRMTDFSLGVLEQTIKALNMWREIYLRGGSVNMTEYPQGSKVAWYQMIQLLPSSFMQKRTLQFSYENCGKMWEDRHLHKQDEWRKFCSVLETLPNSWIFLPAGDSVG